VGTGLLLMALTGDMTGPMLYGLETARALGELRYSRRAEEEADREGMTMLLAARVDPAGMLAFFETIRKEEGAQPEALKYLSSHPMPAERIARLRALAAAGPTEPILPGEDWPALTRRCQPGVRS
jgi:predicted Zn-dependent protease